MDCLRTSLSQSNILCKQIVERYDRTFYLGSLLMPVDKRQAMRAIYAWFRQKDEFIDGVETKNAKQKILDRWFEQLEALFSLQRPSTPTDVALIHAIQRYCLTIEPFQEMLLGQQMDLKFNRYCTWKDLRLYCYRVGGTVGLASAPILGSTTAKDTTEALVTLGIAMQLTNILQDVGADALRGRIYLPLEDLERFSYTEKDLFSSVVDRRWIALVNYEMQRAKELYDSAARGIAQLCRDVRLPLRLALLLYRQDLRAIKRNRYQVFGDRPYYPFWWKGEALLSALWQAT